MKKYLFRSKQLLGVECHQVEGGTVYQTIWLRRQGKEIVIDKTITDIHNLGELKNQLKEEIPIILSINIRGIIHRIVESSTSSLEQLTQQIFPNVNPQDFYAQKLAIESGSLISIARKNLIDGVLEDFKKANLNILAVYLGAWQLQYAYPLLRKGKTVQTNTHLIEFSGNQIQGFSTEAQTLHSITKINEESIPDKCLVAFSVALSNIKNLEASGIEAEKLTANQETFFYKQLFRKLGFGILGFFFFGLLANYLLFNSYQNANKALNFELSRKEALIQERDTLKSRYQEQLKLFGGKNNGKASKTAFYADQIAASLPSTIQLNEFILFPIIPQDDYTQRGRPPQYEKSKLVIRGNCQSTVFYNNWKRAIKELFWVESLRSVNYQDITDDLGAFELEIYIKNPK
ncbi:MAG: hypothetical protein MK212_17545 [Saprospiraceae bacterium]|nr:hypothetical protein [Saprospiraceae bacterium]